MYLVILFSSFIINVFNLQEPCFKVVDQKGNAIPYASVSDSKNQFSTFTDDKGFICLNNLNSLDSLKISSIGFKTVVLPRSAINTEIVLIEKVIDLDEITVLRKKIRKTHFGFYRGLLPSHASSMNSNYPVFTFIENKDKLPDAYLESLSFAIKKDKTVFKLRVFFIAPGLLPDGELLHTQDIIYETNKNVKQQIDLLEYSIKIPEKGYWVGIQSIGVYNVDGSFKINQYGKFGKVNYKPNKTNKVDFIDRLAPMFYAIKEKREKQTLTLHTRKYTNWMDKSYIDRHPMLEFKVVY